MATWKKLATMDNGSLSADITGVAHGGLSETLSISGGGTGADMSSWEEGSLLMYNGTNIEAVPNTGSAGELLVSTGSGWTFMDVADTHAHDDYVGVVGDSTITGNLTVAGSVTATTISVSELNTIDQATGTGVVLNTSGGDADGDGCGIFASRDADSTITTGDPALLWSEANATWMIRKYAADFSTMNKLGMVEVVSSAPAGAADEPGVLATYGGEIYISVA